MTDRVAVLGVGNPDRGDDGVGHAVVATLSGNLPAHVGLRVLDGEPSRILDAWAGTALTVVVDAAEPSGDADEPGTVRVVDMADARDAAGSTVSLLPDLAVSSHGAGIATAIELGAVLDRLPGRLVIVAVTGATFGLGDPMSEPVQAAVAVAAQAVRTTVGA